jgi:hypothetical protein
MWPVHACKFYISIFLICMDLYILVSVCGIQNISINELTYENGRGLDEVVRWTAAFSLLRTF